MPSDYRPATHVMERNFTVEIQDRSLASSVARKGALCCFTDGSRMEAGSGAGVWCGERPSLRLSVPLGAYATVFQAEVIAIDSCASSLLAGNTRNRKVNIFSDSQAALKSLLNPKISSKIVEQCKASLNCLGRSISVKLEWVPGHSGVHGNDKADELAKKGASTHPLAPEPQCGISLALVKSQLEESKSRSHRKAWSDVRMQKQSKAFLKGPDPKRTKELLMMSREELRATTGIYTGHCKLNKHMHTLGLVNSDRCRFCTEHAETAIHVICLCDALARKRFLAFGSPYIQLPRDNSAITPTSLWEFARRLDAL